MENRLDNTLSNENDSINIRVEIEKYLNYWRWFLLSVFIAVSIAVIYAKSQVNIFKTTSSILIKEEGSSSELQAFQDLSSFGMGGDNNVLDEIEILKSRTLFEKVVKKLKLNQKITHKNGLKTKELYNQQLPYEVRILSDEAKFQQLDTVLDIHIIDDLNFEYVIEETNEVVSKKFGEKIQIAEFSFLLTPNKDYSQHLETNLVFSHIKRVLDYFKKNIEVSNIDKHSNIVNLSLKYPVKDKAELVLNTMIHLYNQMSIQDKNEVGNKTDEFITNRLDVIRKELDEIDRLAESYKKSEQLTDITVQSKVFVDGQSLNEQAIFKKKTLSRMVTFMIDDIETQKNNFELLPGNIGLEESPQLSVSVNQYNKLLLERNRLLRNSSLENPVVQNLNTELLSLRFNILESLKNSKEQLEISLNSLNEKEREFKNRISEIPKQTREYTSILRRQKIIAQLYSYLLQKKQENEITIAVTVPNSKVIDRAYSSDKPIAPKKMMILLGGILLGLIIPFIIIYLRDLLDTKFHSRIELEKYVSAPVLGDVPFDKSEEKVIIKQGSRTSSAEAFRLLRTNLDFLLSGVEKKSKTIFVTSTMSGEGKTFISVNTASAIALTGKKTLLIGMDLRAPKITQYLGLPNRNGVTNYVIDSKSSVKDLVFPLEGYENLDVLSSGAVPPNPAELLLNPRIEEMFAELREVYDYIVVDTAPVNMVTDTLMISKYSDMFIYVTRVNYLDKRMLDIPQKLYREKRLPNMAMLINGMDHERAYGYGGYGYGDEDKKKNIIQRIFKR